MSLAPATRQARRENVSTRAAAQTLIEIVRNMTDDELAQLRAAIDGEAFVINPKRANLDPVDSK